MLSDAAQITSSLAYDISYQICNHGDVKGVSPLASIAMHSHETYWPHSGLFQSISRYDRQEINRLYGLSLTDYLELPHDVIEMLTQRTLSRPAELAAAEAAAKREVANDKRNISK